MSAASSVDMIATRTIVSRDDDDDQGSTFDVDDTTTVLGPPVVTTPVSTCRRQRAQPREDDLATKSFSEPPLVRLEAVTAPPPAHDASVAAAATTTKGHAEEHHQHAAEEDHGSTFDVDDNYSPMVGPPVISPPMATRRTKLVRDVPTKKQQQQQLASCKPPRQDDEDADEADASADDYASESDDLHHDEHGSTFDVDDSNTIVGPSSILTSPTNSRRISAAHRKRRQMVEGRLSPAFPDNTARTTSLREEVDEELAIPRRRATTTTMLEQSESSSDEDSDDDDARNNDRLHGLYKTWTCWCPAMFISMLVICTIVTAVLHTKQSKKTSTNVGVTSPSSSPPTPALPKLDPSLLVGVLRESLQVYSSPTTFLQVRSPQAQALQWLLSDILACSTPAGDHDDDVDDDGSAGYVSSLVLPDNILLLQQRFALVVLAMSCGVNYWSGVAPWTDTITHRSTHECEWDGVDCVDGNVTSIVLSAVRLVGKVPVEVGFLSHLTHLDLSSNELEGALPMSLFGMRSLQSLNMMENKLAFSIKLAPFWRLTNLEHLKLDKNYISGELPSDLMTMTQLKTLGLGNTLVQGTIFDFIKTWPNAEQLRFEATTFLVGTIPSTWLNTNLRHLALDGASLTGTIPTELGLLTHLTTLSVGAESVDAFLFGTSQEEELVDATNNQQRRLEGTLPSELGNLENLRELVVLSSNIQGTLPTNLARLTNLQTLIISNTNLNGTIPDEYANILHLEVFSMYGNDVGGTVPEWIADLPQLSLVEVVGRNFVGTLPEALCSFVGLEIIRSCSIICNCCDVTYCTNEFF